MRLNSSNSILLFQSRSFGDAVIFSMLINSIGASFPNIEIHLLCRPQFLDFYRNNKYMKQIHLVEMPFGTFKSNIIRSIFKLFYFLILFRKQKFDFVLNIYPDFREELILLMIRGGQKYTIHYSQNHPLHIPFRTIKFVHAFFLKIIIPDSCLNIYKIHSYIAEKIGCNTKMSPNLFLPLEEKDRKYIGIHPFVGGQRCRMWDFEKWRDLVKHIFDNTEYPIYIFCSLHEESVANIEFSLFYNDRVNLVVGNLQFFFEKLNECKVIIGLDSFAVHAANSIGVPSVILVGTFTIDVWTPPISKTVQKKHNCPFFPCYNIPKCKEKEFEYICMKSIEVNDVVNVLDNFIK